MQCEATEAGGASTHAWMEVYLPGAGWKGFDPTSGIMTGAQHVTVGVSRNPENAAPIAGSFQGPPNSFLGIQVDVSVVQVDRPIAFAPPVPKMNFSMQNQVQEQVQPQAQLSPNMPAPQTFPITQPDFASTPCMDMVIKPKTVRLPAIL